MKHSVRIWVVVVIAVAVIVWVVLRPSHQSRSKEAQATGTLLPVSGWVARESTSVTSVPANGVMQPNEEVTLYSQTVGKVVAIYFQEGSRVKKGDLLLKVDDADLQAQLARAEFQIKLVETRLGRQKILLEREAVSIESYEQLETEYNVLLSDIRLLKVKIDRTEIRAPFNGVMGFRYVSVGSFLQSSTRVSTIVDNSILKIEFSIPEKYVSSALMGKTIHFESPGVDEDIEAVIYAIEPRADTKTHTIKIRARYENRADLVAGMFVKGDLLTGSEKRFILIPSESVVPTASGKSVWCMKNNRSYLVPVETESRSDRYVEVASGIQVGDTILTTGLLQLRDQMKVNVSVISTLEAAL